MIRSCPGAVLLIIPTAGEPVSAVACITQRVPHVGKSAAAAGRTEPVPAARKARAELSWEIPVAVADCLPVAALPTSLPWASPANPVTPMPAAATVGRTPRHTVLRNGDRRRVGRAVWSVGVVVSAGCMLLCSYMPIPLRLGPVGRSVRRRTVCSRRRETIVERGTGAARRFLVPWDVPALHAAVTCKDVRSPGRGGARDET
ncbi:hypothetical protein Sgleb_34080 [Streptomyces glebosus]|uniref:Uncharacterized protein n=1 Tax=Streptomyces glebosus TaxID=249580 RepID=A0A640SYS8_9ACTN|nr:hypothetical protein Sgleb_34080 [Streptomyces glebosus]GHG50447.1 hypothetical protein GCM10010513_08800 [Streptomyces glebosus]